MNYSDQKKSGNTTALYHQLSFSFARIFIYSDFIAFTGLAVAALMAC